jgi:hypothetical protein
MGLETLGREMVIPAYVLVFLIDDVLNPVIHLPRVLDFVGQRQA